MKKEKEYLSTIATIFVIIAIFHAMLILSNLHDKNSLVHLLLPVTYLLIAYISSVLFEKRKEYALAYIILIGGFVIYLIINYTIIMGEWARSFSV